MCEIESVREHVPCRAVEVDRGECRCRSGGGGATEASECGGAEVAGPRPPPPATDYMYVCGEGARYECAFDQPHATMDHPPFEEHMFAEFGKERHVQLVVGAGGELQYREDMFPPPPPPPPPADAKRQDGKDSLMLQASATDATHPPPPPPATTTTTTTTTKKSDKKKSDNNGIKKKKTR